MSSGRRAVFAALAALVAAGGLATLLVAVEEPRPVDVRRVDLSPEPPGVLSASYTTTIRAVQSTSIVLPAAPEARPLPPAVQPTVPVSTTTRVARTDDECERSDGWCLPRDVRRACEWLRQHGSAKIEVRGPDRRLLELDLDDLACEFDH